MTTDHDDIRGDIGAYVLGALAPAERDRVDEHLVVCPECLAEVRALHGVTEAIGRSAAAVEPSPVVKDRVLAAIRAVESRGVRPQRRSPAPWLAAAAAVLVAAGLAVYSAQLRARMQRLEGQLQAAILRADASERQTAEVRTVAATAQRELAVVTAPDVAQVSLKGQAAAPQASARALWSRSRGLLLAASNLPPAPAGRTYQLWVISGRVPPISNGWIFTPDAAGSATALFATPPALPNPTAMAVTIEPDGGTAAPTGAMYLLGSLNH